MTAIAHPSTLSPTHPLTLLRLLLLAVLPLPLTLYPLPICAQITPDGTIGTTVTGGPNFTIDGGTRPSNGPNLFHSFNQFSVPMGGAAIFNNPPDVVNIISRVTGGSVSNIDGLIQANGRASLFLINPAGIVFGSNARLNIGGSFVGTTANSIKFADGAEFSAIAVAVTPLLTVRVPIGLQMGTNPAPIQVNGAGHTLTLPSILSPVIRNGAPTGLIAAPSQTLALVGGDLELRGGSLSAFGGRVELGAVKGSGLVSLTPVAQGWQLGYSSQQFGAIRLSNKSLVDVSSAAGLSAGTIQIQGESLVMRDGAIVLSQNTGSQAAGKIQININQTLDLSGSAPDRQFNTQIRSESFRLGAASPIDIQTRQMSITSGATVISFNFLDAPAGNLSIFASESLETVGVSPIDPLARSGIYAVTVGTKPAADLRLTTDRLMVTGGAQIASSAVGTSPTGTGGNAVIMATDMAVVGFNPITQVASAITAGTFGLGNAGNLVINTRRLSMLEGGSMGSTTFAYGNAGNVTVNATESVRLSGGFVDRFGAFTPSAINSSTLRLNPDLRQQFGLPTDPPGNAGIVTLNAPTLSLDNRAEIGVKAVGNGDGGALRINSDRIFLDHGSTINATTASGEGGNMVINAGRLLLLRHNSNLTATAGGSGNGGNITINAPIIAGFENSDIVANAFQGRGGNIQITTRGIFGLKFRPQLTPENDITASSQFGVNGTVAVNNLSVDPTSGLVQLPTTLADASRKMASLCEQTEGSTFVYTGRGGLPETPLRRLESLSPWADLRDLSAFENQSPVASQSRHTAEPTLIVEANAIRRNSDGTVELVAELAGAVPINDTVTCAGRVWFGAFGF